MGWGWFASAKERISPQHNAGRTRRVPSLGRPSISPLSSDRPPSCRPPGRAVRRA